MINLEAMSDTASLCINIFRTNLGQDSKHVFLTSWYLLSDKPAMIGVCVSVIGLGSIPYSQVGLTTMCLGPCKPQILVEIILIQTAVLNFKTTTLGIQR